MGDKIKTYAVEIFVTRMKVRNNFLKEVVDYFRATGMVIANDENSALLKFKSWLEKQAAQNDDILSFSNEFVEEQDVIGYEEFDIY